MTHTQMTQAELKRLLDSNPKAIKSTLCWPQTRILLKTKDIFHNISNHTYITYKEEIYVFNPAFSQKTNTGRSQSKRTWQQTTSG